MKKLIALTLLTVYLFSTTELYQLLKFPMLVEHFSEHKQKDNSITVWKFLCIHYAHGEVNDDDFDKDMKLPFKSHSNCICTSSTYFQPLLTYDLFYKVFFRAFNTINSLYTFSFSSSFNSSIWQPPKMF